MADTKITALTAITTVDPANDVLPIVDVSDTSMAASGTTKKITTNQLLGASGTATLASATITGDLTVATSVLKVDTANTRVGINTTSINGGPFNVKISPAIDAKFVVQDGFTTGNVRLAAVDNAYSTYKIMDFSALSYAWYNSGSTAMTLNATGLGVGVASPATKLDVRGATNANQATFSGTAGRGLLISTRSDSLADDRTVVLSAQYATGSLGQLVIQTAGTDRLLVDNAGNVGIGVTPSAWGATYRALQIGIGTSLTGVTNDVDVNLVNNARFDGTNWKYTNTSPAERYRTAAGTHFWYTAPSGTAGQTTTVTSGNSYTIAAAGGTNYTTFGAANNNVGTTFTATSSGTGNGGGVTQNIIFTQAMTLAANGQLLLGTSTTTGSVDIGMVLNKPSATGYVGNVYQLNGVEKAFTYISSAAGAFRVDTVTGYTINMVSATNGVYLANGGTSWTALSDERFKDIIEPISNAVAKVGSIRSVIGKFKTESEGTRRSFLIAQDVQAVLPEAVDASNPEKLGVSYTEVIPLLVAAIKELTAEVNALKNA